MHNWGLFKIWTCGTWSQQLQKKGLAVFKYLKNMTAKPIDVKEIFLNGCFYYLEAWVYKSYSN